MPELTDIISQIPYRMALAGGWIDQPFVSRLNPSPPGAMVVVGLEPTVRFMERCGIATGTRRVAIKLWNGKLPDRPREQLVKELYAAENEGRKDPSGSQDMIGLIYPGVCRLDYDFSHEGGVFPKHIEQSTDPAVAAWIEKVIHVIAVEPRPPGYDPLDVKRLDPSIIAELGRTGHDTYSAILRCDTKSLGKAMSHTMVCWEKLLPSTLSHHTVTVDLLRLLAFYRSRYAGAVFSGCGGGYLYVVSDDPVPGSFKIKVRLK